MSGTVASGTAAAAAGGSGAEASPSRRALPASGRDASRPAPGSESCGGKMGFPRGDTCIDIVPETDKFHSAKGSLGVFTQAGRRLNF